MSLANAPTPKTNRLDPWKSWSVRVEGTRRETTGVFTLNLAFNDSAANEEYDFEPGQFNMLYVPGVGESAISVAGRTANGLLQHTIRSVGSVTQTLETAGVGMTLGLRGPFGRSWPLALMTSESPKRDVIIVAGGLGLAPLRALIKHVLEQRDAFGNVSLLLGARSPEDLLYQQEQADWSSIEIQRTVDRPAVGWTGQIGVVTLLLDRLPVVHPRETIVLTCGPEVMMRYVAKSAIGRGIPEQNIWVSLERNMNCAIGLCGHCQLGPTFICKDGPVFRFDEVADWLRVQDL